VFYDDGSVKKCDFLTGTVAEMNDNATVIFTYLSVPGIIPGTGLAE